MLIRIKQYNTGNVALVMALFFCVIAANCVKKSSPAFYPPVYPAGGTGGMVSDTSTKRLLALGDSYTIGQSVTETDRFPNQTIRLLQAGGINMQYPAEIIAQTGWTTQNLLNGIAAASPPPTGPYDLVTLLIGVNNQYQRRDTAEYRIQFTQCLMKAISFSGNRPNRVFVLSIPDYGATPFGSSNAAQIALEIDRFNAINKEVCLQTGVSYTDITPSTRQAAFDPSLIAGDGLHPSGREYAKWAAMLAPKNASPSPVTLNKKKACRAGFGENG